tara:strand:- start:5 stop:451 length:447 start_codon:yes stop_codon:yes gene_type:complete
MSILAAPYVFAGTVSLYLGYKTYNSYYNQPFEYLEIEGLQNENKEKTQEDDIIKKDEELIPFQELINELLPSPPHSPSPPPSPPPIPSHKITKPLPNIFVEDKLVKNNEITKLHNPVMKTILEEKTTVRPNILRRRRRNKKRQKLIKK